LATTWTRSTTWWKFSAFGGASETEQYWRFSVTVARSSGEIGRREIIVGRARRGHRDIGGLRGVIKGESMRIKIKTCLFLELWVSANKLIIDIAGQVSEAV
jgi:hypothetical protein